MQTGFSEEAQRKGIPEWPRHRWDDNNKIDLIEMGWVGWNNLSKDTGRWQANVKMEMNRGVP